MCLVEWSSNQPVVEVSPGACAVQFSTAGNWRSHAVWRLVRVSNRSPGLRFNLHNSSVAPVLLISESDQSSPDGRADHLELLATCWVRTIRQRNGVRLLLVLTNPSSEIAFFYPDLLSSPHISVLHKYYPTSKINACRAICGCNIAVQTVEKESTGGVDNSATSNWFWFIVPTLPGCPLTDVIL